MTSGRATRASDPSTSRSRRSGAFSRLPEAESLAAANKRIGNILKQAKGVPGDFDPALMVLPEEKILATAFGKLRPGVDKAYSSLDYTSALKALAALKAPVDAFFDKVMVMVEDRPLRENRVRLLNEIRGLFDRVADFSKVQVEGTA